MKPLNWSQIRTWGGTQGKAFEELCCQLVRCEQDRRLEHAVFERRGTPDAGVECHWRLPDGSELCWQAKYFDGALGNTQWKELDESVKAALARNPAMTSYTFCLNKLLPDSRLPNQKSARTRWNERREKWMRWAQAASRVVDFNLWDESDLVERLAKPEHVGRIGFWFGSEAFDMDWFRTTGVEPAIRQANTRYTPPLHFEVPLQMALEAFQEEAFDSRLLVECEALRDKMDATLDFLRHSPADHFGDLRSSARAMAELLLEARSIWREDHSQLLSSASAFSSALRAEEEAFWAKGVDLNKEDDRSADSFWRMRAKLEDFQRFISSTEAAAARTGRLVITGEAGSGKTHLLCQTARKGLENGVPSILLLGEQFAGVGEPWREIIGLVGLNCSRDEFLGSLDAAGEAFGKRVVILIDALNEGPGLRYWKNHLGAMLEQARRYRFLALTFSVRDVYAGEVRKIVNQGCGWAEHHGFQGRVADAARHFFRHYGLPDPGVPVLDPEYQNPLFLKLLCEALKSRTAIDLSDPPSFGELLQMVLDDANERLADRLEYDPAERFVHKAVAKLSALMAAEQTDRIDWATAIDALRSVRMSESRSKCLAHQLLSEDLLTKVPVPGSERGDEVVRFSYQRFSDYLIVMEAARKELDSGGDGRETMLQELETLDWSPSARNWLEAAAIVIPEMGGVELPEVLPDFAYSQEATASFLNSIVWRKRGSVTSRTKSIVVSLISHDSDMKGAAFEALIAVATRKDHPLNADWLDLHLHSMRMPERDATWSASIFDGCNRENNIHRLIEWAWQEDVGSEVPIEIVRLASTALVWMFTTSDRFVRDRATKAAVSLLERRIPVLRELLEHFSSVDDPYLMERLYAVACGVALRTSNVTELQVLAQWVYNQIFRNESPPASVLLRDHARAVVEVAVSKGCAIDFERKLLIPPFRSAPPSDPPSHEHLRNVFRYDRYEREAASLSRIYHSVTGDDFNHYVIKDVMQWSATIGGAKLRQSPYLLLEAIRSKAGYTASKILDRLDSAYRHLGDDRSVGEARAPYESSVKEIEAALPSLLGDARSKLFLTRIKPYLLNRYDAAYRSFFSLELFERLILARVLELGWTLNLHGEFDSRVEPHGRESRKPERLGKKYQWIAYDELHARISDNYGLADTSSNRMEREEWCSGIWTSNHRDLDPSLLLRNTPADGWSVNEINWWTPVSYDGWNREPNVPKWIRSTDDVPEPQKLLRVKDGQGTCWLLLDGSYFWRQKVTGSHVFEAERDRQEFHLIFRSYIVRAEHLEKMLEWGRKQNWINERLPSAGFDYHAHLFEHYSSPRFAGDLEDEWCSKVQPGETLPCPFVMTSAEFVCEHNTYDCSLDSDVRISMPSRWLAEKLQVVPTGRFADFMDSEEKIIAWDPSTREGGKSVLLVREENLVNLLKTEKLAIVWTLLGEKNYYTSSYSSLPHGRLTLLGIYSSMDGEINGSFRPEFEKSYR